MPHILCAYEKSVTDQTIGVGAFLRENDHLFAPTMAPINAAKKQVISNQYLMHSLHYLNHDGRSMVRKAFLFAENVHLGQYRHSGEPYITHPLAVAEICSLWGQDANVICAALLHDVIEDQDVDQLEITELFGHSIYQLVEGLTKLTHIEFANNEEAMAANFDKLLRAGDKDHRVLIIKLADRLHNMRTLDAVPSNKKKRIARETHDLYGPLARRLGLHDTYLELENLSFKYLHPWRYHILSNNISQNIDTHAEFVRTTLQEVELSTEDKALPSTCVPVVQSPYILYEKIRQHQKKHGHVRFHQPKSFITFKILVDDSYDCYLALGILHHLYKPQPGRFKDYIALPKRNGYKALHTNLMTPSGMVVGFQIRTYRMEKIAQSGILALDEWELDDALPQPQALLHTLHTLREHVDNPCELLRSYKADIQSHEIMVFDEYARQISLARPATALDFAYHISHEDAHHTLSIEVNGIPVHFAYVLRNGDVIKLLHHLNSKPSNEWLNWVKTRLAKNAIAHFLATECAQR